MRASRAFSDSILFLPPIQRKSFSRFSCRNFSIRERIGWICPPLPPPTHAIHSYWSSTWKRVDVQVVFPIRRILFFPVKKLFYDPLIHRKCLDFSASDILGIEPRMFEYLFLLRFSDSIFCLENENILCARAIFFSSRIWELISSDREWDHHETFFSWKRLLILTFLEGTCDPEFFAYLAKHRIMKGFIRFDVSSRKYPGITFSVAYHEDFFFWIDDDSAHDGGKRGILHERKRRAVLYVYFYTFNEKEQIEFSLSRFFAKIRCSVSRERRFLPLWGNDTLLAWVSRFLPEFAITASCHQYEFKKPMICFSLFPRKDPGIFVLVFPMCRIAWYAWASQYFPRGCVFPPCIFPHPVDLRE